MSHQYSADAPSREEVDAMEGGTVLDFGTNWCSYCRAAEPVISEALDQRAEIRHIKVEDGKGRRLGRAFGVKLWPTLVFLLDGREVARLVRPADSKSITDAVALVSGR